MNTHTNTRARKRSRYCTTIIVACSQQKYQNPLRVVWKCLHQIQSTLVCSPVLGMAVGGRRRQAGRACAHKSRVLTLPFLLFAEWIAPSLQSCTVLHRLHSFNCFSSGCREFLILTLSACCTCCFFGSCSESQGTCHHFDTSCLLYFWSSVITSGYGNDFYYVFRNFSFPFILSQAVRR